jgi:putative tryptophan/tyrosine transport system substrate-binding protein
VVDRRAFISALAGSLLAAPLAAGAQQVGKVWRVGYLEYAYPTYARDLETFRQRLRELGYVEGRNLVIESRVADSSFERLRALAAELVDIKVDVIATSGNATISALMQATKTIPIVMISSGDPVGSGFVSSLAHPGGNVTGLANLAEGLSVKWLELLTQSVPGITRVGVVMVPNTPPHATYLGEIKAAAQRTGIVIHALEVRGRDEIEHAFTALTKANAQGIVVLPNPVTLTNQARIVELAAKNRLPAMYPWPEFTESGGLMAYSTNRPELYWRSAAFVARILKGAKPADLPIEQPTKFELVINLKTAKALGLTIPPSLLQRADQVIE